MVGSCDVTRNDFSARFLITRMNKFSPSYDLQKFSSSASRNNPTTSDIICSAERRNFSVLWAWKFLLCAMVWWMGGQEGRQMGSALSSVCAKSLHRETKKTLLCDDQKVASWTMIKTTQTARISDRTKFIGFIFSQSLWKESLSLRLANTDRWCDKYTRVWKNR